MNKSELVGLVAEDLQCSRAAAARALDAVLAGISRGVESTGSVTISGFGAFTLRERAGRTVRNPSTGEPIRLEPSVGVGFRAGCRLRELVNH